MTTSKNKTKKTIVTVVGRDSWSGPEILFTKEFVKRDNAEKFCTKFNSKNNKKIVPDYYEVASIDSHPFSR